MKKINYTKYQINKIAMNVAIDKFLLMFKEEDKNISRDKVKNFCKGFAQELIDRNKMDKDESKGILLLYWLKTRLGQ
tara:strand:- start:41 stop:271 length:231 start_codon:yes stop_codon:yes gene_type:complete